MPTYSMNFATFDVSGAELDDATTYVVRLVHPEHPNVVLVVFRYALEEGKTLREHVAARVSDEMIRLSGYTVLENSDVEWGGAPAIDVASRYRNDLDVVYLRQAHIVAGGLWTVFALSGPLASRPAIDAWLEQIMSSLKLRGDA